MAPYVLPNTVAAMQVDKSRAIYRPVIIVKKEALIANAAAPSAEYTLSLYPMRKNNLKIPKRIINAPNT